ncbi:MULTISPECIES: OprD family outer membrane porin [unclassified Acinetobacter]|uniref:OprD family outer membrane porin n=1 Tax=unclassified Acinetobacter TaxID=196816 RepID=UPI00190DCCAC|nr:MULTISPECIES: OprD family outer membrane porin [unclassified Acinetobacter]MBK0062432.1 outer membrane porin, OprD family [Acinetobacter sp. S55]MBK0066236.1 outer membrane porin, OprD family [Acinetobacter sp. S54]
MYRQTLWTAIMCAMTATATTTSFADFIEDSQIQLKFKNFYLDRQYNTTPAKNWGSWSQAATLDAKSGYAQVGNVQLGIDVLAQYAVRLDGRDRNADWVLPYNGVSGTGTGQQDRDFGKIGATLKAKISQTELRVGEILPITPVVVFDPSRQLLTTYNGVWLESKDIKNTKLTLGYLDSINARYENQPMDFGLWPKPLNNDGKTDGMYVAGIDYQFNNHWSASYFYGDVTNIYRQNYLGMNYKNNYDRFKLDTHIRLFDNAESGDALYGDIDNQALSFGSMLTYGAHSFGLSYQQMFGDQGQNGSAATGAPYFPSLAGWVPQPYLDNWSVVSFVRKHEKSVGFTYSYDFNELGLKGLKTTAKYWHGWDVNSNYESSALTGKGKEAEFNFILNYVVPEGKLKGLGFQWMYINVDFDNIAGQPSDLQEHRIATTYTYTF